MQCESRLKGDVYLENYEATRFMLCKLEEAHQTRENKRDLWAHDASERPGLHRRAHPAQDREPGARRGWPCWKRQQGTADAIRERCAHQLGNLTLSGYNSKLGTMEFLKKRDRKNDKGDFIGYRNGLYLNAELATRDEWNEDAIQARTIALSSEVKAILGLWNEGPA
jgi:hypothetical protein